MAQVTVELGKLIDRTDFELFDFDYTVDDQQFKTQVEQALIDFYYDYEIGFETPDMFKRKFKARFTRIIGYYNKLYNTTLLEYNPLINSKMTEALDQLSNVNNTQDNITNTTANGSTSTDSTTNIDQTVTDDSTRTDNLTTTNNTNEKTSDYPQQAIAGGDYLDGERTATSDTSNTGTVGNTGTNQTDVTNTNNTTATTQDSVGLIGKVTNTGATDLNYQKTIEGLTGTSYQELINLERQNILRLTSQIIDEMKACFILIY